MARAQVKDVSAPERIQGIASPVSTYVRPADPARSPLHELAQGLASFDEGLSSFMSARKEETDKADKAKAITDFHRNNQKPYADAVREGLIPPTASKSYVEWYKKQQGNLAGLKLADKFNIDYQQWEGRDSDDPEAFGKFLGGWMTQNVGEDQDPEVLAGLAPHLDNLASNGYDTFNQDRAKALRSKAQATSGAIATDTISRAHEAGRAEGSVDYDGLWTNLMAQREEAISKGERGEDFDKLLVDSVILQAEESGSVEILNILDKKTPGQEFSLATNPEVKEKRLRTIDRINSRQASQATDIAQTREKLEKQRHESLLSDAVLAIHNGKDVPEETITELSRRDGEIRHKLSKYKKEYQDQETDEDPQALMEVYQEIDGGAGKKFVLEMRQKGVIKDPATFLKAMDRADAVKKANGSGGVFASPTYKDTVRFITEQVASDRMMPDGTMGLSDEAMEALYDYRSKLLDWDMWNSDATLMEKEKAAREAGDYIRSRIKPATSPDATTKNEYLSEADEAKQAAEPQQSPRLVQPPIVEPEEGNYIPQAIRNIWDYFAGDEQQPEETTSLSTGTTVPLSQSMQQNLEAFAKKKGLTLEEAHAIIQGRAQKMSSPQVQSPATPAPEVQPQAPVGPISRMVESVIENGLPNPLSLIRGATSAFRDNVKDFEQGVGQPSDGVEATNFGSISDGTRSKLTSLLKDPPKVERLTASNVPVAPILRLIGGAEGSDSGEGYNATLTNGKLTGGKQNLVGMTLGQIDELQTKMLEHPGNKWNSSALGRYQIVQKTLRGLKQEMGLADDVKFTPELQDKMAMHLLERRGLSKWQAGQMSDEQFMDSLSKEWASLPTRSGSSYYGQRVGTTRGGIMIAFNKMRGRDVASVNADEAFRSVLNSSSDLVTISKRGYQPDLDGLHPEFRSQVSELQAAFGKTLPIVSGFRDRTRNAKAGGAKDSQHTHRNAVDIDVSDMPREERIQLIRTARQMGFGGIGVYANSIHIDAGSKRAWGPSHHKDSIPAWAMEALNS